MELEKQRITVEEFERFADSPENQDRLLELIDGEIVEKTMPTEEHGTIVLNLGSQVRSHVRAKNLGRVGVEIRHRRPGDNYNARQPDISFIADSSRPVVKKGSVPQMPDLAVEVKSPDDRYADMRRRADYYINNGVKLVWLIYPEKRLVEVYRPDADSLLLNEDDMLEGFDVLPGFALKVSEIFE